MPKSKKVTYVAHALFGLATLILASCAGDDTTTQASPDEEVVVERSATAILMDEDLNAAAEVLWDSAGFIDTYEGTTDLTPTTDEGWNAVFSATDRLTELSEILKDVQHSQGRPGWDQISSGMAVAAEQARTAAHEQDGEKLFDAGAQLYKVCVACHQVFWSNNRFVVTET